MGRGIPAPTLLHFIFKDHQSRRSSHIVVSVAAATVEPNQKVQPSLPRLSADTLMVPALKSRARFTWSLPRPRRRFPARAPHWQSLEISRLKLNKSALKVAVLRLVEPLQSLVGSHR